MKWKSISTIVVVTVWLILLGFGTTKTLSQETPNAQMAFVCAGNVEPPTTYAYIPGEINLKPLMSWHSEYLMPGDSAAELCQRSAQKLQSKYNSQQQYLLASNHTQQTWIVCLVTKEGDSCLTNDSVYLFSLNNSYQSPRCVMEGIDPIQCPRTRGKVISIPGGRYTPAWWPFN
jgi:hypothetical protein